MTRRPRPSVRQSFLPVGVSLALAVMLPAFLGAQATRADGASRASARSSAVHTLPTAEGGAARVRGVRAALTGTLTAHRKRKGKTPAAALIAAPRSPSVRIGAAAAAPAQARRTPLPRLRTTTKPKP